MSTAAQIAANRANAELSTGPTSEAGKTRSSLNAVKTGLTGRTVLLPGEDAEQYKALVARYMTDFQPVGDQECMIVQSLADTQWRLLRIPCLESGIYALGHLAYKDLFPEESDPAVRHQLIQTKIYLDYSGQLDKLMAQEARLHRQQEKNFKRLHELQRERARRRGSRLATAAQNFPKTAEVGTKHESVASAQAIGFELSMEDIEISDAALRPAQQLTRGQNHGLSAA
jgi:hypothetical protein